MRRFMTLVAVSTLVVGSVASTGWAADAAYSDSRMRAYENSDQWRQDHSADDLNRAALPRAMGTMSYGASGTTTAPSYTGSGYTGSGYTGSGYTGTSSTTTTTTTTIYPAAR
jgi:hypothetical protein